MPLELKLPSSVVTPTDVIRLRRELELLDDALHQATLRKKKLTPKVGRSLETLCQLNKVNLNLATGRRSLLAALTATSKSAPVVTMSFAVEPSAAFMAQLVEWLRRNVHPALLVRIGLQPNIAAGFTLRTPSKLYDFSLRNRFNDQKTALIEQLRASQAPGKST